MVAASRTPPAAPQIQSTSPTSRPQDDIADDRSVHHHHGRTMTPTVAALGATLGAASPTLAAAKQQLRSQMKQRLAVLSQASVAEQSAAISHALVAFPPFSRARRIAVFLSVPAGEVQTDAIVRHALAAGKQVFVPYLHATPPALFERPPPRPPGARVMDMVQLRDAADYASLARDRWGIPSVSAASVAARRRVLGGEVDSDSEADTALDLILLPGVAFDVDPATHRIHRCGHGRGFYDYFLHRYALKMAAVASASSPLVRLYGLALSEQILPAGSVPMGPHDQPLDGLVAGNGTIVLPEETRHA